MFDLRITRLIALVCAITLMFGVVRAQQKKRINLGFFEGGRCLAHDILRDEFSHQLEQMTPSDVEIIPIPQGYYSAKWNRDSCRILARELVRQQSADIIVAMGPWVVEDLLAAGYTKPILALHRVDPHAEGLLDTRGWPIVENLTVQQRPSQIARDIDALVRLTDVRKLGVLYFPSGDEQDAIKSQLTALGQRYQFEVITAEGYDNGGAYAFFKAYAQLAKKVDAVYLFPMWAMDGIKIREFFLMTRRDQMPTFVWEGAYLVQRGALASNSGYSVIPEARFAVTKLLQIIEGATPADLQVQFDIPAGVTINETTAKQCGVSISATLMREAQLIKADPSEESREFTILEALQHALNANPGHLARHDALTAASEAALQTKGAYLPQLYAQFSATRADGDRIATNDDYVSTVSLYQTLFSLETIRNIKAANVQREISETDLRQSQLDLELAVTMSYLGYREAVEASAIYDADRNRISRFLELAFTRRETEGGPERDVTRWDQERYQASIRVSQSENELTAAGVLLNSLLNFPGHNELTLDTGSFSMARMVRDYKRLYPRFAAQTVRTQLAETLVDEAMLTSPALAGHRVRVNLQEQLLAANRAQFFPTVGIRASYNYVDRDFESPFATPYYFDGWYARAEVKLPLFLGGSRFREVDKQKALLSRQEYLHDEASLKVMRDVLNRFDKLMALAADMPGFARAEDLSITQLEQVISEYESGRLPLIDVLDAQRNSIDASLAAIDARYRFYRTMALLTHSMGWSAYDKNQSPDELFFQGIARLTTP